MGGTDTTAGEPGLRAAVPLPADAVRLDVLAAPPAAASEGETVLVQGGGATPRLRYYALDALGSVRVTFDAAGTVIGRADYEPFGAAVTATTTGTQPRQQFTGHERDGEVGLDYFGARLYLPVHGRLPSVDPLYTGAAEDPQRWNRYAYALNTPIAATDPDGRCVEWSSDSSNNVCGNASYIHPAYVQEHDPFLFLLMGYSDYGHGGGGSVDMSHRSTWPPQAQQEQQDHADAATSVTTPPPGTPPPSPPHPDPDDPKVATASIPIRLAGCTSDQLGLTDLAAVAAVIAGQPLIPKRFVTPGSSSGTSLASKAASALLGDRRFPFRLPTVTGGPLNGGRGLGIAMTNSAARFGGRAVPLIGWGFLAYDALSIGRCTFRGE